MATSLQIAAAEIGYVESPPNSNHTKYGKEYGADGNPWCAMFVTWCERRAGNPQYHFASVIASIGWAKRNGLWHPSSAVPQPGWAACKQYTATTGHTGLLESIDSSTAITIEGNTSYGNDRNGGIVMRRRRSRSWWTGFIALPLGSASQPTPQPPQEDEDMPTAYPVVCPSGKTTHVPLPVPGSLGGKWHTTYISFACDFGGASLRLALGSGGSAARIIDPYEIPKGLQRVGFETQVGEATCSVTNNGPQDVTAWVEAF